MMRSKAAAILTCLCWLCNAASITPANAQQNGDDFWLSIPAIISAAASKSSGPDVPPPPAGFCSVPNPALAEDTSQPDHVIGNGTAQSCTSAAVVSAITQGGVITFNCGRAPVEIKMLETARVFNNTGPEIIIDGGNKITLSGMNQRRILYMNTCDSNQVFTTPHCQNQDHPRLTVQNLIFKNGNSKSETQFDGGGAIWVRGGRFKIVNSIFENNVCADTGPDVRGAAVRVFSQYQGLPVYVTNSIFGGNSDRGNACSNGGALSSIGVSFSIFNSLFSHNRAIGIGANPVRPPGAPGGGSGGAIYNDGNQFDLKLCGTTIRNNTAREGGSAVFFVSNNRTGTLSIDRSLLTQNPKGIFETNGFPGIFFLGRGNPMVSDSTIE